MARARITLAFVAAALVMSATVASADGARSAGQTMSSDGWRFTAATYAWLIGITGNVTAQGQTVDTNATFVDLVQKSNTLVGLMGYFEANKGPAGVYADLVYTRLDFGVSRLGYRNPLPRLAISASAGAALTYELFIAEVGGTYEVGRWSHAEGPATGLDVLLAFRYWNNSLAATFDADATFDLGRRWRFERSFGLAVARADTIQWVDPVVGLRLRHRFTPHQEIMVRADIGGFGLTGSQLSWQTVAVYGYGWQLEGGQSLVALLGFRALGVNYSSGWGDEAVGIDEVLYGPIVGVSFRF